MYKRRKIKAPITKHMTSLASLMTLALAVFFISANAQAVPVTYTFSGVGGGSLGGSAFTDASFIITATADTSQIVAFPGFDFSLTNLTATVFVSGIGTGTFVSPTTTVVTVPLSVVVFGDLIQDRLILSVNNPAFAAYDLSTSIGPLSGPAGVQSDLSTQFGTTLGSFSLTSGSTATFQAVVVPEPATVSLLVLGILALVAWRKENYGRTSLKPTPAHARDRHAA